MDDISTEGNIPLVNIMYGYKHLDSGEMTKLDTNHAIHIGSKQADSITYPNQILAHSVHVYEHLRALFPNLEYT